MNISFPQAWLIVSHLKFSAKCRTAEEFSALCRFGEMSFRRSGFRQSVVHRYSRLQGGILMIFCQFIENWVFILLVLIHR